MILQEYETKTQIITGIIAFIFSVAYIGLAELILPSPQRTESPTGEAVSEGAEYIAEAAEVYETALATGSLTDKPDEPVYTLTDEEKNMLCYVAETEDNTSVESRMAVIQTVLNRTESAKFPDTVKEVLYAPKQFQTIRRYTAAYEPSAEALEALDRVICGEDIFDGGTALFFASKRVLPQKVARGLYLIASFGNHYYGQK